MAKRRVGIRNGALFNQTSTLWNNLVAYYTGDGTPDDALGNYNGTLVNGATYGTGKISQGFSFDGVNDFVDCDSISEINSSSTVSYSYWGKKTASNKHLLVGSQTSITNGFWLSWWSDGNVYCSARNGNYSYTSYALPFDTNWHHFVGVYNGTSVKIYIDGVLQVTNTTGVPTTLSSTSGNDFNIGYLESKYTDGNIDEVGVWNRELSASEVTELYNNGNGKQYTPPVVSTPSIITDGLVLNLDAGNTLSYPGTGTDWFDLTSNNNDATLINGASYITDGGGSISFDGVNDFIQVGQISNVTTTTYISAWIKLGSLTDDYRIFGFGNGSSNTFQLIFEGDATNKPLGLNTYNNDLYGIDTTQVDYTNGWFNVTIGLHSNDFSSTKIYINGNNIQTSQKLGTSINRVFNNTFTIGTLQWNLASGWYFNGQISDVKIYNKTLTDSEVLQNYNATKGRFGL